MYQKHSKCDQLIYEILYNTSNEWTDLLRKLCNVAKNEGEINLAVAVVWFHNYFFTVTLNSNTARFFVEFLFVFEIQF